MSKTSEDDVIIQLIIQVVAENKPKDMNELILQIQDQLPIQSSRIIEIAQRLQKQGKIDIETSPNIPIANIFDYTKTNAPWFWLTITIASLSLAFVYTIPESLYPWSFIRNVFGLFFLLVLPGYTSMRVLFPIHVPIRSTSVMFNNIERIALSIGTSLALVPLVTLILNYLPWGIGLTQIVVAFYALILALAAIAVVREQQIRIKILAPRTE